MKPTSWDSLYGPWAGSGDVRGAGRGPWTLIIEELHALHAAIPDNKAMLAALGITSWSSRKIDRALQLLRRAGLIEYDKRTKTWRRT